ncbi:MAG: sensor histidine kinase [Chloroflexi bacterium]|nr:sensor histidine kinase [Chloroflexota bacterium]
MTEALRAFFEYNFLIILFIYGQVFFVLGLAIALQSWRHSRLTLARNLNWLAAFGFTHGIHEWGDVFIPIQAQYLPVPFIDLLLTAQLLVLALSFACLFQFGVESLRPLPGPSRYVRYLPTGVLTIWLLWMFGWAFNAAANMEAWHQLGSILARYSMGFPGGLLAAYGLRRQARTAIVPLKLNHIAAMLRLAGLALLGYAIFGGLLVPAGDFFPANRLNEEALQAWTLLPVQVYRSFFGLLLMIAILRALEVFRVELDRRIGGMEESQLLLAERERIGRELHDGTLQTIYAAGLLLRTAERSIVQANDEGGLAQLRQSVDLLDQAVADIRGHIGQLRPQPTGQSLAAGLQELATTSPLRSLAEIDLRLSLPAEVSLTPAQVGHLLAIANEAMSNIARHAQATRVVLSSSVGEGMLCLQIEDNGHGLPADFVLGYGLNNMRDRSRMLGGDIRLHSTPGKGTTVRVEIPVENRGGEVHETHTSTVGG